MTDAPIYTRSLNLLPGTMERFEALCIPEPNSGCWLWLGALRETGYGEIFTGSKADETNVPAQAHRVAYELYIGPIPEGLALDHKCRLRCCVNPGHLEPVTAAENTRRGSAAAGRTRWALTRPTCKRGHPWTEETIYQRPGTGHRMCRICTREDKERYRRRPHEPGAGL